MNARPAAIKRCDRLAGERTAAMMNKINATSNRIAIVFLLCWSLQRTLNVPGCQPCAAFAALASQRAIASS